MQSRLYTLFMFLFALNTLCSEPVYAQNEGRKRDIPVDAEVDARAEDPNARRNEFTYTNRNTANFAFIPRAVSEYAVGEIKAPVQINVFADPTSLDTNTFMSVHWNALIDEYVTPGKARLAFRPLIIHAKAALAAIAMECVGPSAGVKLLQNATQIDPLWGTRSYERTVDVLNQAAQKMAVTVEELDACYRDSKLNYEIGYWFKRDSRALDFFEHNETNIFVNGSLWPGLKFLEFAKRHIEREFARKGNYGEDNPILKIQPTDRVAGNPKAPVVLFDYANIIRIHNRPLFSSGMDSRLRQAISSGQLAYVYRPFYFPGITHKPEIAARCVPPARFFEFLDYMTINKDFWMSLDDPTEMLESIAKYHGADEKCFKDPKVESELKDIRDTALNKLDVIRVSTYFYRGEAYMGNLTFEALSQFIEDVNRWRSGGEPKQGNKQ